MAALPETMRAVQLVTEIADLVDDVESMGPHFEVVDVPVPKLKKGEVLVRMSKSPMNPSDLSSLKGTYNSAQKQELPWIPGFEGSGTIVQTNAGIMGWSVGLRKGRRVAVASKTGGCWGEYVAVNAMQCLVLPDDVTFEAGASSFVNPLTAISFIEIAKKGGHRAIVHTAAASALGKMLVRLCVQENIGIICIVRKAAQVSELEALGATLVLDSTSDTFDEDLSSACAEHRCSLAFDAVSGELTGRVLAGLLPGGVVKVYGSLSYELARASPVDLIFKNKRVEGYWLTQYMKQEKNLYGMYNWTKRLAKLLSAGTVVPDVAATVPPERFVEGLCSYVGNMSAGKVLVDLASPDDVDEGPAPGTEEPEDVGKDTEHKSAGEEEEGDDEEGVDREVEEYTAQEDEEKTTEELEKAGSDEEES